MSPNGLHKLLEADDRFKELRGTSYGGVRLYVQGEPTNPRLELLSAFATVLDVREDWLLFDEGEMTEEEQAIAEAERGSTPRASLADVLAERLPLFAELPPVVQAGVVHTALRWVGSSHPRFEPDMPLPLDARAVEAAAAVLDALGAPVEAWEGMELDSLGEHHLTDYALAMLHALALTTPRNDEVPASLHSEWASGGAPPRTWRGNPQLDDANRRIRKMKTDGQDASPKEEKTDG